MTRCMGCMEEYSEQFNVCPHCGYVKDTPPQEAIHIKPGTVLSERYIVGKVIGYGGFGVTYIGFDTRLQQKIAIKEYFPTEFSTRMPGDSRITVLGDEKSLQFSDGLDRFVDEARRLAKFQDEEGIVRVFDSFTENDTAYIVMEYLDGETLTAYMERCGTIDENEAVKMLEPVMKSLQTVHEAGILHRDIAPDNIFITKSGNVKLIDFGASRYATTSYSRSLTVIIKPGYSPEEQYRSRGDQGAHTDVYAIGATLYKMITGITPPDAMKRRAMLESKNKDILEEPHRINKNLSINRENAILNAMNIRIEDRTPDMMTFYRELHSDKPAKRIYGKVKKLDLYSWPLWAKIVVPTAALAVIISAVLLLTGVIKFDSPLKDEIVVPDGMTTVPNIEGMLLEEAEEELQEANLLYSIDKNVESEYVDPGKVVYQTPKDGAYLDINGTVSIAVSRGIGVESPEGNEATVPFLTACTLEEALELLEEAGLGAPIIEYEMSDSVPEGQIISQSIDFGEKVEVGTQVTLIVSSGPPKFAMPDVVGVEVGNAKNGLTKAGFVVKVQNENGEEADKGVVIEQSIPAGEEVTKGAEIVLTVSNDEDVTSISKEVTAVTMQTTTVQTANAVTTTTTKVTTAATTKVTTAATTTATPVVEYGSGDIDGDGIVTSDDAQIALEYYANKCVGKTHEEILAELGLTDAQIWEGDMDGDGTITSVDASSILGIAEKTGNNIGSGDVDGDGIISNIDALYVSKYYAYEAAGYMHEEIVNMLGLTDEQIWEGDVNGDRSIDTRDASVIQSTAKESGKIIADINDDGAITDTDTELTKKCASMTGAGYTREQIAQELGVTAELVERADVDFDGYIDAVDASRIAQWATLFG